MIPIVPQNYKAGVLVTTVVRNAVDCCGGLITTIHYCASRSRKR